MHFCIFIADQRNKDIGSESKSKSFDSSSPPNIGDNIKTIDRLRTRAMPIDVRTPTNNHSLRANHNGNKSQRVTHKKNVSSFSLRDWRSILLICLLFVAMKLPNTRRNSHITPQRIVGKYCRPLGFKEEDYCDSDSINSIVSNEHDEGTHSIGNIFRMGRSLNFFRNSFRSQRWKNLFDSINCKRRNCRHKCEFD